MRTIIRQLVTCTLLALYGAVAMLGHGLHWLSSEDHHHHGLLVGTCGHQHSQHDHHHGVHPHHHHHHGHGPGPTADCDHNRPVAIASTDCAAHAQECDICTFLLQARSAGPQIAVAIVWQHVISATPAALQRCYSPTSLGAHGARGPPLLLA